MIKLMQLHRKTMKNNAIAITIYLAGGSENARQSADAKVEPRINMTLKKGFSIV